MQTHNAAGLLKVIAPDEQLNDRMILLAKTVCNVTQTLPRDLVPHNTQSVFNTTTAADG